MSWALNNNGLGTTGTLALKYDDPGSTTFYIVTDFSATSSSAHSGGIYRTNLWTTGGPDVRTLWESATKVFTNEAANWSVFFGDSFVYKYKSSCGSTESGGTSCDICMGIENDSSGHPLTEDIDNPYAVDRWKIRNLSGL